MQDRQEATEKLIQKLSQITQLGDVFVSNVQSALASKKEMAENEVLHEIAYQCKDLTRRYGTVSTRKMLGFSTANPIYKAEADGELPEPTYKESTDGKKIRAGYTVNEINKMREYFDRQTSKVGQEGHRAQSIGFMNLKGGSQKTSHAMMFAHSAAIHGKRSLLVDTDLQATLSIFFGYLPDSIVKYEHTIAPFMLQDDESLVEAGWEPGTASDLEYAVQETAWDYIDIIPSCTEILRIDSDASKDDESEYDKIMRLRNGIMKLADQYDYIIFDGTPSLNLTTMNVVAACDMLFIPTPASFLDFSSTLKFGEMIRQSAESHLLNGSLPNYPTLKFFITKYSNSKHADFMAQAIFKVFGCNDEEDVLAHQSYKSESVNDASNQMLSIYELDPRLNDNPKRLKETEESFEALFKEMRMLVAAKSHGLLDNPVSDEANLVIKNILDIKQAE